MKSAILDLGLPSDTAGWIALAAGSLLAAWVLTLRFSKRGSDQGEHRGDSSCEGRSALPTVLGCALLSALFSAVYIHVYLRGGPRIIDATSYWLEARAISEGHFAWLAMEPSGSFHGRFLLHGADGHSLGVIFPPGYPLVLSLGFLLRCPLLIGPVLGFLLVIATAEFTRIVTQDAQATRIAALLSALCAALRYHTADTMSHGLAGLMVLCALLFGFRAQECSIVLGSKAKASWFWILSGWCAGLLFATRPATALALAIAVVLGLLARFPAPRSVVPSLCPFILGAAVPVAVFFLHQRAVTGRWLVLSQAAYYLVADGPPGCFRYGFGEGIGCLFEHKPYVESVLPDGYGFIPALRTSLRRLGWHSVDALNSTLLVPLVIAGMAIGLRDSKTRTAAWFPLALVAAYSPFYFDGSYPGGGGRMLADAIPIEHVLVAIALTRFKVAKVLGLPGIASLMLLGFAFHTQHHHALLRDRDGGRPMYEPDVVKKALGPEPRGLLLVDTDHAFNLGFDPSATPATSLLVARHRKDDHDRLLWMRSGMPPVHVYEFDPWDKTKEGVRVIPWEASFGLVWRFEAENLWPPREQEGGYAVPAFLMWMAEWKDVLMVEKTGARACVLLDVPIPSPGTWKMRLWFILDERIKLSVAFSHPQGTAFAIEQEVGVARQKVLGNFSMDLPEVVVSSEPHPEAARMRLCTQATRLALDRMELQGVDH